MKSPHEIFKEVLTELGFYGYKQSEMSNSDNWLCTTTAMERYADQFKYDFSKNCECITRGGETWCCNQCGLPTTMKENQVSNDIDDNPEPIDDDAWLIY
jgi:hypothetical protein